MFLGAHGGEDFVETQENQWILKFLINTAQMNVVVALHASMFERSDDEMEIHKR